MINHHLLIENSRLILTFGQLLAIDVLGFLGEQLSFKAVPSDLGFLGENWGRSIVLENNSQNLTFHHSHNPNFVRNF
jgi:hypothetical protein